MENYYPEKKKSRLGWILGCSGAALFSACLLIFLVFGGFAGLLALVGGEPEGVTVLLQLSDASVEVGDTFNVSVILKNEAEQNVTFSEIQMPNELLDKTLLIDITPFGEQGIDYGDQTGFAFDLIIAPNGEETVTFTFQAIQPGNIIGSIDVKLGAKTVSRNLEVLFTGSSQVDDGQETGTILGEVIPYQSVVQIIAIVDMDGDLVEGWSGSGTIISQDGLILTNAHVVLSDRYYKVVDLVVSITNEQDQPPQPRFYADILQADAGLDLAVIKVRSDLNGGPANFPSLGIASVPLGRSDDLGLGDPLIIIGYPGIGGETITLTRGEVSGFTAEEAYGNRAYIKTSATIAGGNSGGLAANQRGEIIGVPTAVGTGDIEDEIVDCRRLVDTNRDGVIDEFDNCVPTGGFINALRPIRLALPMIEAAQAGQVAIQEDTGGGSQEEYEPGGEAILEDDFNDNAYGWSLADFSEGRSMITGGQLVVEVDIENYLVWTRLPETYDSIVLVTSGQVQRAVGDGDFGFICGYQDSDNFSVLEISEDGYYIIYTYVENEYISLLEWTYSDVVAAGGPFTLAAYCGPDRLALALNDTVLGEATNPDYRAGQVGLIVGSYENPGISVAFDDFYILEP